MRINPQTSEKTIERLLLYRRILLNANFPPDAFIFSHQLAQLSAVTAAQVRHDLMAIGYFGSPVHGYQIEKLLNSISEFVDGHEIEKVALVGVGHLGRAVLDYARGRRPKLMITAAFDNDPDKIDRVIHGVRCYGMDQLSTIISQEKIIVAILTIPAQSAQEIAEQLVAAGIRGILNYAPINLNLPPNIYVENRDMLLAVEKVAYFARKSPR
jgi:redox-sensing transcriptional repressor